MFINQTLILSLMYGRLTKLRAGGQVLAGSVNHSFDNHKSFDGLRQEFEDKFLNVWTSVPNRRVSVPSRFLHRNVHSCLLDKITQVGHDIYIGQYCNEGLVIPRGSGAIVFDQLYNCAPLISLVRGDEDFIAFLHTWAVRGDRDVVDEQVKHWMHLISDIGEVEETIFAPRKKGSEGDTFYCKALKYFKEHSKKTIVLYRSRNEVRGLVNGKGVYLRSLGYHLWDQVKSN